MMRAYDLWMRACDVCVRLWNDSKSIAHCQCIFLWGSVSDLVWLWEVVGRLIGHTQRGVARRSCLFFKPIRSCNCNCNLFAFHKSRLGYNPEDMDIVSYILSNNLG